MIVDTMRNAEFPILSSDYPLGEESVALFRRDGHVLLRGVATPDEIAAFRPVILAARDRYG